MNGHADPLSDLSVSGSTMKNNEGTNGQHNHKGDASGKLPPKRGPIIDMRAMLNNAVKGATQEYLSGDPDPSVSFYVCLSICLLLLGVPCENIVGPNSMIRILNKIHQEYYHPREALS